LLYSPETVACTGIIQNPNVGVFQLGLLALANYQDRFARGRSTSCSGSVVHQFQFLAPVLWL